MPLGKAVACRRVSSTNRGLQKGWLLQPRSLICELPGTWPNLAHFPGKAHFPPPLFLIFRCSCVDAVPPWRYLRYVVIAVEFKSRRAKEEEEEEEEE